MKDGYRRYQGFLDPEETGHWRRRIDERQELFHSVSARGGLNLLPPAPGSLRRPAPTPIRNWLARTFNY